MKIIEPSAVIIETELEQLSLYQRIAYVAGVCYQREPRKTEEEAREFCRRMVEIGHHSTLEMAVVHLVGDIWDVPSSRYITSTMLDCANDRSVITGSIRSFLEANGDFRFQVWNLLADQYPVFFTVIDPPGSRVRFAEPHEIPWQHRHVAVRFIVNRAVSHELVRHRPMSFLQESQRYCRYEDEVVFIRPEWVQGTEDEMSKKAALAAKRWLQHMVSSEYEYRFMLKSGLKPQQARAVLPNSTKTELIAYASLPQWKHMFNLRCSPAADPEMTRIMRPLREQFKQKYPEAFKNEQDD